MAAVVGFTPADAKVSQTVLVYMGLLVLCLASIYTHIKPSDASGCGSDISWQSVHVAFATAFLTGLAVGSSLPSMPDIDKGVNNVVILAVFWIGGLTFTLTSPKPPQPCSTESKIKQFNSIFFNHGFWGLAFMATLVAALNIHCDLLLNDSILRMVIRSALMYVVIFMLPVSARLAANGYTKHVISIYNGAMLLVHALLMGIIIYTLKSKKNASNDGKPNQVFGLRSAVTLLALATVLIPASYDYYTMSGNGTDPDGPLTHNALLDHRHLVSGICLLAGVGLARYIPKPR